MTSENDLGSLVARIDLPTVSKQEGRPYMLLDGILRTAHNTLINIAIGRAAQEVHNVNLGYLCFRENPSHYCDQLFQRAGVEPVEYVSYSRDQSLWYKLWARGRGAWEAVRGGAGMLGMSAGQVPFGDLVYDSIIRQNPGVHTIEEASFEQVSSEVESTLRLLRAMNDLFEGKDIHSLVLSHKLYSSFGIPARMATASGSTFYSKSRAHVNRVASMDDHYENDYFLSEDDMDTVIHRIGVEPLRTYTEQRFEGDVEGHDVQFAFSEKEAYEQTHLKEELELSEEKPVAVIAPHAFSDAPHCDRDMVYRDYYQWYRRVLSLTRDISHVQWLVKPHPSSSLYDETGVAESLARGFDHVQLVPPDVQTDSVLRVADAVLTVRGTIGMEALLFDCQVVLAGNAIYEEIESVDVCLTEEEYEETLRSISGATEVPRWDKERAMAVLYYRNRSYNYVSPIFGPERPPGLSEREERRHDQSTLEQVATFLDDNSLRDAEYYRQLVAFFENGEERLSILQLKG